MKGASSVSNSFFFFKTEGLRVKDEGLRIKGEGQSVKDKGQRVMDEGGCAPYYKNAFSVTGQSFHYYRKF